MSTASCTGKDGLSWAAAVRSARGLHRRTGATVVPYHCRQCGFAHVGNAMGGNVSRRIKRDRLERIERRELWATS